MDCLHINCQEPWFSYLKNGVKPVEGRKAKEKYLALKSGDAVCFHCDGSDRSFMAIVERVDRFATLLDYLQTVTIEKALPGVKTLEDAIAIYLQWSTLEEIERVGFVGIWLKDVTETMYLNPLLHNKNEAHYR